MKFSVAILTHLRPFLNTCAILSLSTSFWDYPTLTFLTSIPFPQRCTVNVAKGSLSHGHELEGGHKSMHSNSFSTWEAIGAHEFSQQPVRQNYPMTVKCALMLHLLSDWESNCSTCVFSKTSLAILPSQLWNKCSCSNCFLRAEAFGAPVS